MYFKCFSLSTWSCHKPHLWLGFVLTRPTKWNAEESGKKANAFWWMQILFWGACRDFRTPKQIRICLRDLFLCSWLAREFVGWYRACANIVLFRQRADRRVFSQGRSTACRHLIKNLSHCNVRLWISLITVFGLTPIMLWIKSCIDLSSVCLFLYFFVKRYFFRVGSFKSYFEGSPPFQKGYFRVTSCV